MRLQILFLLFFFLYSSNAKRTYKVVSQKLTNQTAFSGVEPTLYNYKNETGVIIEIFADNRYELCNFEIEYLNNGTVISNPCNNVLPFERNNSTSKCGFRTPSVSYYNGFYYLLYAEYDCNNYVFSLAKTTNPMDVKSWKFLGRVLTNITFLYEVATILWATPENGLANHYLFWTQNGNEINIAVSNDPLNWQILNKTILKHRDDLFDNIVVPSAMPLRLKTDDFLFIYGSSMNSDRFSTGWAILDAKDPTYVVQHCEDPLMTPTSWHDALISTLLPDPYGCPVDVADIIGTEYAYNAECFFGFYFSLSEVRAVRVVSSWIDNDAQVSTPSSCMDVDSNCQTYSDRCSNPLYLPLMCKYCKKACNLCDNQSCTN